MSSRLIVPKGYVSRLEMRDTERAIKFIKDTFERDLAEALGLERISAPLFLTPESGLNDDLNGVERAVAFDIKDMGCEAQIVHSHAKWKRMARFRYGFTPGTGLYTDMNAIRRDEELDNLHSIYVDQWDWEKIITRQDRNLDFLKETVRAIHGAILETLADVKALFPKITLCLKKDVFFITTQELLDMYPGLTPKERENAICREHGSVFLMQIGGRLSDGTIHDGRAPDYDDWQLNGDLLYWNDVLEQAFEISSMGIRVDPHSLDLQLKERNQESRRKLLFHRMLLAGELPLTMGGGIGQSRLCMLLLQKAHIGQVQASLWSDEMIEDCGRNGIFLL
ncbi:MAG: aspartate--ammonia ligase [Clostridia bacterium]|nr:aspartate--ammonia ligase [Clostridia bacterium]